VQDPICEGGKTLFINGTHSWKKREKKLQFISLLIVQKLDLKIKSKYSKGGGAAEECLLIKYQALAISLYITS
jgi:hypothetical protein